MRLQGCFAGLVPILLALGGCQTNSPPVVGSEVSCLDRVSEDAASEEARYGTALAEAAQYSASMGFAAAGDTQPATHTVPQAIGRPIVNFPICAASYGLSGQCRVYFDVTAQGAAQNIIARCSHKVFAQEAARGIRRQSYQPATIEGKAVDFKGVQRLLRFELHDIETQEEDS